LSTKTQTRAPGIGRILAVLAIYAAAGWAAVEIFFAIREGMALQATYDNFILVLFIAGFPVAALLAWHWQRREHASGTSHALVIAASMALLAGAALLLLKYIIGPPQPEISSVAVMPCSYEGDEDYAYLGEGLAEEVHGRLAELDGLRVPAWRAVVKLLATQSALETIAQHLDVERLASCRISRVHDQISILVELIDPADGVIWSKRYEYAVSDLTSALGEVSRALAGSLRVRMGNAEEDRLQRPPTMNAEAYEYYLRAGRGLWARTVRIFTFLWPAIEQEDYERAAPLYEKAIELDPGFAAAYADLAQLQLAYGGNARDASEETWLIMLERAKRNAEKANSLDDCSIESTFPFGRGKSREEKEAARRYAIECSPNDADAWFKLSRFLSQSPQLDPRLDTPEKRSAVMEEAFAALVRAVALDPTNCTLATEFVTIAGRWEPANAEDPRDPHTLSFEETRGRIRSILVVNPDCGDIYGLLSDVRYGQYRMAESMAWKIRQQGLDPENPFLIDSIVGIYSELDMLEQAEDWALRVDDASPFVQPLLWIRFQQGDPDPLLDLSERFITTDQMDGSITSALEIALLSRQPERVVRYLELALARNDTDDPMELLNTSWVKRTIAERLNAVTLAMACRVAGREDDAVRLLALVHRPSPEETDERVIPPANVLEYLEAQYLALSGRPAEALEVIRRAVEENQIYRGGRFPDRHQLVSDLEIESLRKHPEYAGQLQELIDGFDRRYAPEREKLQQALESGDWEPLLVL